MSLSISFVSLHTHTQKPPTFLSKESHITCMQVWDLQMVCKKGILLWPGRAGSRKGQTLRQHGSVMSKMRARMPSRSFSVFLLVLFGDIWSTSRNAIKKPNKCQSITSLRWNWSVNRTISVLWKSYSLEVCCGLIHACNKKWNSFVSTNYFFPVLVHNITFHGSHMECVCCQNSKTSATSCLSKTKFIVEIYICICVNYAR